MALVKSIAKGIGKLGLGLGGGLLGLGVSALTKKKSKAQPGPALPLVSRDDAAAIVAREDELRKRRGGMDDILNGSAGAEARLTGGKLVLGS